MKAPHTDKVAEFLSRGEEERLAEALPDHFAVYGDLMPGEMYRLSSLGFEPFFGVAAGSAVRGATEFRDPQEELLANGWDEGEAEDLIEDYLDEFVSEDAPHWRETNPFAFSLLRLREYFSFQFDNILKKIEYSGGEESDEDFSPGDFLRLVRPYSKDWFEILVLHQIEYVDFLLSEEEASERMRSINHQFALAAVGSIGRIVEHYRWRFSYGTDAQRGRSTVDAARKGGLERNRATAEATSEVLIAMQQMIERGATASNAARLAFKAAEPGKREVGNAADLADRQAVLP